MSEQEAVFWMIVGPAIAIYVASQVYVRFGLRCERRPEDGRRERGR